MTNNNGTSSQTDTLLKPNQEHQEISERMRKIRYFDVKNQLRKSKAAYWDEYNEILMSCDDNSDLISLILRELEDEEFVKNKCASIMEYYANREDANLKNLFSVLMFNWHEQNHSENKYFLVKKFTAFGELTGNKSLFEKLLAIIDDESVKEYHQICVKIIYYYFNEAKVLNNQDSNSEQIEPIPAFTNNDIISLISKVLKMNNDQYKNQILKILVVHLSYSDDSSYADIKSNILEATKHQNEFRSPYKQSYQAITKHCDEKFFEMAFYLKQNLVMKFKVEYKNFIEMHKKYFGEFWVTAIKFNSQLLNAIAELQDLVETKEFLLIELNDPEIKSSPTIIFEKISEFQAVFNEPLDDKDEELLTQLTDFIDNRLQGETYLYTEQFKRHFKNNKKTFRLFFGRKDFKSPSLFEKIITMEKFAETEFYNNFLEILNYIWHEFGLKDKPEVLIMKNFQEKRLIDLVLDTSNDNLFILFLMPEKSSDAGIVDEHKLMQFMILKNALYYDYKTENDDKCLIEFNLKLIDKECKSDYKNWKNVLYLFEEVSQYNIEASKDNVLMCNLFHKVMEETFEEFDEQKELKLPKLHFLLGLAMIYLDFFVEFQNIKDEGGNEKMFAILRSTSNPTGIISRQETEIIPVFTLLSLIINKNEDEFLRIFPEQMILMEESYKTTYKLKSTYARSYEDSQEIFHFYEKYSSWFCFILLYAAIKTNQKDIVKKVFEYNNFLITIPEFPANMVVNDVHHLAVLGFLNKKYELGRGDLPKSWITKDVFEKFLDSRVTFQNGFYKIDCLFMLPYYNQDNKSKKLDDDLCLNEDYDTMEYILNDQDLKHLVTHPVMEVITRTKLKKYSHLYFWNFFLFLFTYIVPTTFLVYQNHCDSESSNLCGWLGTEISIGILLFSRFPFIIMRELFQWHVFYQGKYFQKISNIFEFALVLVTFFHLIFYITTSSTSFILVMTEVINVLLMMLTTAFLFPFLNFAIYMECFKKVILTYFNVLIVFMSIFLGCTTLMFIIFDKNLGGEVEDFQGFGNAFMKYIIMFSGEMGIDPTKLIGFIQGAAIGLIIILTINQSNLIISIVIGDVKELMEQSIKYNMTLIGQKYVEIARSIRMFYALNIEDNNNVGFIDNILYKIIKKLSRKDFYAHRLQCLYIEKETGNVYADTNKSAYEFDVFQSQCVRKTPKNIFMKMFIKWLDQLTGNFIISDQMMEKIKDVYEKVKTE
ncbi:uncharacterized protein [Chironomus tepperi]|uniref:uncharacterized protein n=1 Tax=Chironomus tepperi TaxID=113505 RepID=UPI00391F240E